MNSGSADGNLMPGNSQAPTKRIWAPSDSTVEKSPTHLEVAHEQPGVMYRAHWHAQVEVNFITRGTLHYRMHDHTVDLGAGNLCMFWGGLPHQAVDASVDADFVAIHLPLINFFRLRLPETVRHQLMHGATMVTARTDEADYRNFDRWSEYLMSKDMQKQQHAIEEVLLRIERIVFEPFVMLGHSDDLETGHALRGLHGSYNIGRICNFIAANFRHDIDSADIASSADIHPKYAMSMFKKSTGMTLNEYVSLLRLSYAQALLINNDNNVLRVAMESGFRSLSAFNTSFRKISGMSPSNFRRYYRERLIES
jgi:AraC family transcriptional regulator, melibiose operon regulatory protein